MKKMFIILTAIVMVTYIVTGCSATPAATTAPATTAAAATTAATTTADAAQTYTGYLVDQACGITGVDIQDGSDLTKLADKHTLSCARMAGCIASGYGLYIKQADGTFKFYKFDTAGSKTALDNIINKTTKTDNLLVDVSGAMSGDTITVATITEK